MRGSAPVCQCGEKMKLIRAENDEVLWAHDNGKVACSS